MPNEAANVINDELESLDLSLKDFEVVPSRCRVTRRTDGRLFVEVWTEQPASEPAAWNYAMLKLPSTPWPT